MKSNGVDETLGRTVKVKMARRADLRITYTTSRDTHTHTCVLGHVSQEWTPEIATNRLGAEMKEKLRFALRTKRSCTAIRLKINFATPFCARLIEKKNLQRDRRLLEVLLQRGIF